MDAREVYDAAQQAITDAVVFAKTAAGTTLPADRQDATRATWNLCCSVPAFEACFREAGEEDFVERNGGMLAGSGREFPSHAGHSCPTWIEWVLDTLYTLSRGLKHTCRGYLDGDEAVPFDFSVTVIIDHWDAVVMQFEQFADN